LRETPVDVDVSEYLQPLSSTFRKFVLDTLAKLGELQAVVLKLGVIVSCSVLEHDVFSNWISHICNR
jgi:hypothetical protein